VPPWSGWSQSEPTVDKIIILRDLVPSPDTSWTSRRAGALAGEAIRLARQLLQNVLVQTVQRYDCHERAERVLGFIAP